MALSAKLKFKRGCVKSLFMALRAKLSLDGDIFFLILRSKIKKKMSPSKECFAAYGGKRLFTQPLKTLFGVKRQIKVQNRRIFRDFAKQNHEKYVGFK